MAYAVKRSSRGLFDVFKRVTITLTGKDGMPYRDVVRATPEKLQPASNIRFQPTLPYFDTALVPSEKATAWPTLVKGEFKHYSIYIRVCTDLN